MTSYRQILILVAVIVLGFLSRSSTEDRPSPKGEAVPEVMSSANQWGERGSAEKPTVNPGVEDHVQFEKEGWRWVTTPPPDPAILDLAPARALTDRETALVQLQTTEASNTTIPNVTELLKLTDDAHVRSAAIAFLGRSRNPTAQEALIDVFAVSSDESRSEILSWLRPQGPEDPVFRFLEEKILTRGVDLSFKEQALFALVTMYLGRLGGVEAAQAWSKRLDADDQRLFFSILERIRKGWGGHS